MTSAERDELRRVLRQRQKVGKMAIDQRAAEVIAEGERAIAKIYYIDDARWAEITGPLVAAERKAEAKIDEICAAEGIPREFRPSISLSWQGRGLNAFRSRRQELYRVLTSNVEKQVSAARLALEQSVTTGLEMLAMDALDSSAARDFLATMPSVEALVPFVDVKKLAPPPKTLAGPSYYSDD